ncbi:MAG: hypothetical protein HY299_18120 [Verrucomicrobia bacterium]|nr:hypothetical protein [Verrucomicrobiota bacterium]
MKNTLLLAAATATLLTAVNTAKADEPFLSPRAKANQTLNVSGNGSDPDLVRGQNDLGVAAASKASGHHSVIAGASKNAPDLVHGQPMVTASPKGLQQLRESGRAFQIAPLK